jgi:hypothetical protein
MPLVGIGELARLLNRDPEAIRFAVQRGRITRRSDGLFDADQALAEWDANTLHERGHDNPFGQNIRSHPSCKAATMLIGNAR